MGEGQILINQLNFEKTNITKSGKVASLLLTNLGIKLNPEKTTQFTKSNKRESIKKNKRDLLINPSE